MKKPRALQCYICGKEYGLKRIEEHIGKCKISYEKEQEELHPNCRQPCPVAPQDFTAQLRLGLGKPLINDVDSQVLPTLQKQASKDEEPELMSPKVD